MERDGELYYSLGPRFLQSTRERDLRRADEGDVESLVSDGFIRHDPPTEVEELADWPEAARAYEESAREKKSA
ncbi:MAG: hypothetical protein GWO20_12735 [Candidatus Korarchaeota archaeon]|nr:hypothetical protein [Candidatus Korarchaeota archaeon]